MKTMIDTLSLKETAKVIGTTRANIQNYISRGALKPERGKEHKTDWRVSPELLAEFTQQKMSGLFPIIGLYLLADSLYKNDMLSDERYDEISAACHDMINTALTIDALIQPVTDMIEQVPALKELMNDR